MINKVKAESVDVAMSSIEPKPGDTILITSPDNGDVWQIFVVGEVKHNTLEGLRKIVCKNGSIRYLSDTGYEVIEPSSTIPKPGDTIIITDSTMKSDFGKKYVVIKPTIDLPDLVYIDTGHGLAFFYHRSYETIKRTNTPTLVSCPDCHDTGQIQLLTSTVKCKCNDNG